jgi:hypothetical protein
VFAVTVFGIATLLAWGAILVVGLPLAIVVTPWIVLAGAFVLPGLTAAKLPFSAAWLLAILLFADHHRLGNMVRGRDTTANAFAAFLAVLMLLILWSPDRGQGVRMVVQGGVALGAVAVFRIGLDLVPRGPLLRSTVLAAAALAAPVIWFRLDPASELAFLTSGLGRLLIEPVSLDEVLRGYWFQMGNSLDDRKAGAVFINANVASVFLSMHLAAAVAVLRSRPAPVWAQLVTPVLFVGILATGSRIGAIVAVLLALGAIFYGGGRHGSRALALALVVALLAIPMVLPTMRRFDPAVLAYDQRIILWPLAVRRILDAPLLGGGFGDWNLWLSAQAQLLGFQRSLPPHNLILHLALWGGALCLVAFGAFLYAFVRNLAEHLRRTDSERTYAFGVGLLLVAVLLHAMFDNFFLFDWHVGPAAGGLMALMWTRRREGDAGAEAVTAT